MSNRNYKSRRNTIISLLAEFGEVSVEELATGFETSEVTIRKDLAALEKSGLLLRRYGGAIALPKNTTEFTPNKQQSKAKHAIAQTAANLIQDHARVIIDSGSTTSTMIALLAKHNGLVIMTNALSIANQIHELANEPTLLMTGGTWDSNSESFQGKVAESVLRSYDFDQLFIGADGIDMNVGTTTFNELIGLSQVMAEVSRQVIVMIESDKFGRKIPNSELAWDAIDVIITDNNLPPTLKIAIEDKGVKIIIAE